MSDTNAPAGGYFRAHKVEMRSFAPDRSPPVGSDEEMALTVVRRNGKNDIVRSGRESPTLRGQISDVADDHGEKVVVNRSFQSMSNRTVSVGMCR